MEPTERAYPFSPCAPVWILLCIGLLVRTDLYPFSNGTVE